MPYQAGGKEMPAEEPAPAEESTALIAKPRPGLLLLVGYGGFVVIIWLMMFKPFKIAKNYQITKLYPLVIRLGDLRT